MKRFLVLQVTKYLDGTYSTRVVFESDDYISALEEYERLCDESSDFFHYRLKSISFPKF